MAAALSSIAVPALLPCAPPRLPLFLPDCSSDARRLTRLFAPRRQFSIDGSTGSTVEGDGDGAAQQQQQQQQQPAQG